MPFFHSCTNEITAVKAFESQEEIPMEQQENIHLLYSDSAILRLEITAPEALNYSQLEEPKLVFSKGIEVNFYASTGEKDTYLRSDYAIRYPLKKIWEAKGNVQVINKKGEKLETEFLIWDEADESISSEEFVRITTGQQIIMGEGFKADQTFDSYEINKVTGEIYVEDDQDS